MLTRNGLRFINKYISTTTSIRLNSTRNDDYSSKVKERRSVLSRPPSYRNEKLTKFIASQEDFQHVEKLIPNEIVPDPPVHESYPTPSGWVPVDVNKALQSPYQVLRTRFHNYPIYAEEREGGSRKLVRVRNIQGDIWKFDEDLREYLERRIEACENRKLKIVSQVNEVQRHVLIKGHFENYVSEFLKEKGF